MMVTSVQGPVNLNTADPEELTRVSGISWERALKIIEYRNEHGPFKSWDDLKRIPGFSPELVDLIHESGSTLG